MEEADMQIWVWEKVCSQSASSDPNIMNELNDIA
jgi:hypothetical protein